jgi:hypothetical protein
MSRNDFYSTIGNPTYSRRNPEGNFLKPEPDGTESNLINVNVTDRQKNAVIGERVNIEDKINFLNQRLDILRQGSQVFNSENIERLERIFQKIKGLKDIALQFLSSCPAPGEEIKRLKDLLAQKEKIIQETNQQKEQAIQRYQQQLDNARNNVPDTSEIENLRKINQQLQQDMNAKEGQLNEINLNLDQIIQKLSDTSNNTVENESKLLRAIHLIESEIEELSQQMGTGSLSPVRERVEPRQIPGMIQGSRNAPTQAQLRQNIRDIANQEGVARFPSRLGNTGGGGPIRGGKSRGKSRKSKKSKKTRSRKNRY